MTTFWCEHAWLPTGVAGRVRVTLAGDRIAAVEAGVAAQPGDRSLTGLTLPGPADAHSHAFHRALRGRTHAGRGSFWTWRERMYAAASRLDPASYLVLARAAYAELVLAGWTAVGEFHYLHHRPDGAAYPDPNAMGEALVQAAAEAGVRLTLLDTLYLAGGLDADGHAPLDRVQRRFSDGRVGAWAARTAALVDSPRVRHGRAVHSVRAVPIRGLREVAGLADGRPLHVHLSEQPAENDAALAHYGLTPTGILAEARLLGPATTAVHATHLTDADIALLAGSGTGACFCPTTERDLADGIGPARELVDAGVPLSLGSDQHAVVDPFAEVQTLEGHERLRSLQRGRFTVDELVTALSPNGYRALGWPEGGRLEAGALADFTTVRLDSPRTAGSLPQQALYAATATDVLTVVVGGETVVSNGEHRLGDVGALIAEAMAVLDALPELGPEPTEATR